jgi:hypothetical protein
MIPGLYGPTGFGPGGAMTRWGTSLVDCLPAVASAKAGGGADRCAETPIAPNEMAAIQTGSRFIGVPVTGDYSVRRTIDGSTRVARYVGTARSMSTTIAGSGVLTSYM